jgi:hypothetical protein
MIHNSSGSSQPPFFPQHDERLTFIDKLILLFSAPVGVFVDVRRTPPTPSNWLIPLTLFVLLSIVSAQLLLANTALAAQLKDLVLQQLDAMVESGALTRDQAELEYERFGPGSVLFTIASLGGFLITPSVTLFALALVFWLVGRSAMASSAPYLKVVEIVGLTFLVWCLESVVGTILMLITDSIYATPSLALLVLPEFDTGNLLHLALARVNLFTFWMLYLIGTGLSVLFQRDFPKVLVLILALWFLWTLATLFIGVEL